jgi:hypothetical protein
MEGCEESTYVFQAEKYPLLEAVARERMMKTQQGREMLIGCCGDL